MPPRPPEGGEPLGEPPLEPVRVLRPRRTDALAELFREHEREGAGYESFTPPRRPSESDDTEELPRFRDDPREGFGFGPGLRRAAVAVGVAAAALVGFGSALLLPGRGEAASAGAPAPSSPSAPPSAQAPDPTRDPAADPDGPGTLREGDSGPEVTDLQRRLRRIPGVYDQGPVSGVYDSTLREAVARFQVWYGVRGDESGVYGDDTRAALESRTG